jgi:hypothetical protein
MSFRFRLSTILGAVILGALAGCRTQESYSYVSTTHLPQTVTLLNTRTGESIWSQEIPVGRQLNITFVNRPDRADSQGWDEMRWSLTDIGNGLGGQTSTIRVPPPSERRLDVTVRDFPEERPQAAPVTGAPSPAPTPRPRRQPEGIVPPNPKQPSPR